MRKLARAARLCVALLAVPMALTAQTLQREAPKAQDAALYTKVLAWERYYGALLQLSEWTIVTRFDSLPPNTVAKTIAGPNSRRALVLFDPKQLMAEPEPWRVVLHELLHIVTAQAHVFTHYLAPDERIQAWASFLFEDLIERMSVWSVWPAPPGALK